MLVLVPGYGNVTLRSDSSRAGRCGPDLVDQRVPPCYKRGHVEKIQIFYPSMFFDYFFGRRMAIAGSVLTSFGILLTTFGIVRLRSLRQ